MNGLRISEPKQLADGDLVRVGSLELKVSIAVEPKLETEEDISRLLLGGDDPVGMNDTTRSIEASDIDSTIEHGISNASGKDAAEATLISSAGVVDEDDDSSAHGKAVEEILKSRSKPGNLPKSNKPDGSSRDAAADALKIFWQSVVHQSFCLVVGLGTIHTTRPFEKNQLFCLPAFGMSNTS